MKVLKSAVLCLLLCACFFVSEQFVAAFKEHLYEPLSGAVIVLDAGHGGKDEGAIVQGVSEKDINLSIVFKLKELFEEAGAEVVLTRSDGNDLSSSTASNHKREDMKNRIRIINDEKNDLLISIHLNTYNDASIKGAQTFYEKGNASGELLARCIQVQLLEVKSKMTPKSGDYYLLNNARVPSVLVECGFLSNAEERDLLQKDDYQQKLAELIFAGTLNYFTELGYE